MDLHHTRYERAKHLAGVATPCVVYYPIYSLNEVFVSLYWVIS